MTKFLVVWLHDKPDPGGDLHLEVDNPTTLEDGWRKYNELVADPNNKQVILAVPLKEVNR